MPSRLISVRAGELPALFAAYVTEIALSHLDTQWGFTDSTPVEGRCVFAYAGILIKELCTSRSWHLNHSHGASIQTLDTIQLHCRLQLRRTI